MVKYKELFLKYQKILLFFCLNFLFILIYTYNIALYPRMHMDEGYFSNPAYNLVTNGEFGTYSYRDFLRFEEFTFWQPPVYILILALFFQIFGLSLIIGRVVSVIFALIIINIFYIISSDIIKKGQALFLTLIFGTFPLIFYSAHQIRMDIAVSAFTFLSFYFLYFKFYKTDSEDQRKIKYLIIAGIFSALALLSHPNGLFSVILNIIGIIIYDLPLKIRNIFSKKLILSIKTESKNLIIFIFSFFITVLPYLIIILLYWNVFMIQFTGSRVGTSLNDIWGNITGEYTRFYSIFLIYLGDSFLNLIPTSIKIILLIFLLPTALLVIINLSLKKDEKIPKILLLYIVGMLILFAVVVSNKTIKYVCIFAPYYFLAIVFLIANKELIKTNFKIFNRENFRKLNIIFKEKLFPFYKITFLSFLLIGQTTILINYYTVNQNTNPNYIRSIIEENSIPKDEVLVGSPTFYIPLHDYNYVFYNLIQYRLNEGDNFNEIVINYEMKTFIYDARWSSLRSRPEYIEMVNESENFFANNCTLIVMFNSTIANHDPIFLYRVN